MSKCIYNLNYLQLRIVLLYYTQNVISENFVDKLVYLLFYYCAIQYFISASNVNKKVKTITDFKLTLSSAIDCPNIIELLKHYLKVFETNDESAAFVVSIFC